MKCALQVEDDGSVYSDRLRYASLAEHGYKATAHHLPFLQPFSSPSSLLVEI